MLINTKFFEVYSGIESELKQNIENRAKSLNIVEVDESINMITGKAYETLMKELGDVPENLDLDDYEAWIKSGESTDEFKVLRFMLLASSRSSRAAPRFSKVKFRIYSIEVF